MTTDKPTSQKSKRRWHQYSLRTLMIIVTLFAVACSWFTVQMQQAKRQREAVEALIKLGGFVGYDYETNSDGFMRIRGVKPPGPEWLRRLLGDDFFNNVVYVNLTGSDVTTDMRNILVSQGSIGHPSLEVTKTGLEQLEKLKQLRTLRLSKTQITDDGLEHLVELKQLITLFLDETNITDTGLKNLKGLKQLRYLYLNGTQVTDNGLEQLKGLNRLHNLELGNTKITDAGMVRLKGLTQLRILWLDNNQITGAGFKHLEGLRQLEYLDLRKTKVTNGAVKDLQKALPKLKIEQ
jgi:Leucine rich repeat